jgi:20S proteasome subunit beta 4
MGDNLIALVGRGFVLMAADTAQTRSVLMLDGDVDKMIHLDESKLLGCSGPQADRMHFSDYVKRNLALYSSRTGETLTTSAAASWTRNELATALRKGPYQVNMLFAGYDKSRDASGKASDDNADDGEASLYTMDYLAMCHKVQFACQGYANYFLLGLLDKHYKEDMNLDDALVVLKLCIEEMKTRFVMNTVAFAVKVVDSEGIRVLDKIGTA